MDAGCALVRAFFPACLRLAPLCPESTFPRAVLGRWPVDLASTSCSFCSRDTVSSRRALRGPRLAPVAGLSPSATLQGGDRASSGRLWEGATLTDVDMDGTS